MDQAYSRLWKQLLIENRAFSSSAFAIELMQTHQRLISAYSRGNILDLGAGNLDYKPRLAAHASRYVAMDSERAHPELDCIGDGEALPFAANSFDFIFCSQVLEHTPHPWRMVAEMGRVLMVEGCVMISVPFLYYLHGEPHDYHRFTRYALRRYCEAEGLEIIEEGHVGGFVMFVGMLFQNIWLLATYRIAGVKRLAWGINRLFSHFLSWLDRLLGMRRQFPIVIYVVAKKKGESQ